MNWAGFYTGFLVGATAIVWLARLVSALSGYLKRKRLARETKWNPEDPRTPPSVPTRWTGAPLCPTCTLCLRDGEPVFRAADQASCVKCALPTVLRTVERRP